MINIAVCDDELTFLNNTISYIKRWSEESGIRAKIFQFDNGDKLINQNTTQRMDIIFLDIFMPLLNGMDTARELRQKDMNAKIVFLTSSPEFALESYDVKAHGYLLKPISYEKIKNVLDEFSIAFHEEPKNIVLKTIFGYQKIYFHDIEYVEAQNKRVTFHLRGDKSVEVIEPLYFFEDKLTIGDGFYKCHRSYLVYLQNVNHFTITNITTKSGRNIPIARGYGKAFQEAYFSAMFKD